jgi:hypothetical protein
VYKVKNEYESSHVEPIEIEEQAENGGSMHEMLNATQDYPQPSKSSQIVKNPAWVKRTEHLPNLQDMEVQSDLIEEN